MNTKWLTGPGIIALGLVSGCRGCNEDTPYTPFGVASTPTASGSTTPEPTTSAEAQASGFDPKKATQAPPKARTWKLGGETIQAPDNTVFVRGLVADFDGDGVSDIVAQVAPKKGTGAALWAYKKGTKPKQVWTLPSYVPTGPGCSLDTHLAQTGPRSVTIDIAAQCESALLDRVPVRNVAVLAPLAADHSIISLRAAAPAPNETLDLEITSLDRDGDGRDDVVLNIVVGAKGAKEPASARLSWLDRAAGPSRDAQEPSQSLIALAQREVVRSPGKNTGLLALARVNNARRLVATLCAEAKTPRLFDEDGNPFRCGELQRFTDALGRAEVNGWLSQGDVLSATGVIARDGWYLTPMTSSVRDELIGTIRKKTRRVEPTEVTRLTARVPARTRVRWSPLAFEQPEPTLIVRTPVGLMRASADGTREQPATPNSGARAWPLEVSCGETGYDWTSVEQACGRSELIASFAPTSKPSQPLGVLAARPGTCGGATVPPVPLPVPLGPEANGMEAAIVAGARVGKAKPQPRPGLPRSPDGNWFVVSTALGVLVVGDDQHELWSAAELTPPHEVSDCVVANGGDAIACVKGTQVILARE